MFLQISIKSWLGQGLQGLHTGQGLEVGDQLRLWRSSLPHAFVQCTRRGARARRGRQHLRLYRVHTFLTHHLWRILATKSGLCFFGFERLKVHFLLCKNNNSYYSLMLLHWFMPRVARWSLNFRHGVVGQVRFSTRNIESYKNLEKKRWAMQESRQGVVSHIRFWASLFLPSLGPRAPISARRHVGCCRLHTSLQHGARLQHVPSWTTQCT